MYDPHLLGCWGKKSSIQGGRGCMKLLGSTARGAGADIPCDVRHQRRPKAMLDMHGSPPSPRLLPLHPSPLRPLSVHTVAFTTCRVSFQLQCCCLELTVHRPYGASSHVLTPASWPPEAIKKPQYAMEVSNGIALLPLYCLLCRFSPGRKRSQACLRWEAGHAVATSPRARDSFACLRRNSPTTGRTCLQTSRNACVWMNPSGPLTPARWVEAAAKADVIVFPLL